MLFVQVAHAKYAAFLGVLFYFLLTFEPMKKNEKLDYSKVEVEKQILIKLCYKK